jgi:hypothetical protein
VAPPVSVDGAAVPSPVTGRPSGGAAPVISGGEVGWGTVLSVGACLSIASFEPGVSQSHNRRKSKRRKAMITIMNIGKAMFLEAAVNGGSSCFRLTFIARIVECKAPHRSSFIKSSGMTHFTPL